MSKDFFITGQQQELWLGLPITSEPKRNLISLLSPISVGDTTANLDGNIALYQGDRLYFTATDFIIISETTTLPAITPILPSFTAISVGDAISYGLLPLTATTWQITIDGETFDFQDNELFKKRVITNKNVSITTELTIPRNSSAYYLLDSVNKQNRNIYLEIRNNPFIEDDLATLKGLFTIGNFTTNSNGDDFINCNITFNSATPPSIFTPLLIEDEFVRYCPLSPFSFYKMTFRVTPEEDNVNYCPLVQPDYTIDFEVVVEEDNVNYCPLDTTGFFDFTAPPE